MNYSRLIFSLKFNLIIILLISVNTFHSQAAIQQLRVLEGGKTQFTAIGKPAMLRISGVGSGPSGFFKIDTNNYLSGEVTVNLSTLQSGIELRDEHMKKNYLQTENFPSAKLSIQDLNLDSEANPINIKSPINGKNFKGQLTLHGVTKPVEGTFAMVPQSEENKITIKASYSLNLSDYNIDIPSYMGIKVADKVNVESVFDITK